MIEIVDVKEAVSAGLDRSTIDSIYALCQKAHEALAERWHIRFEEGRLTIIVSVLDDGELYKGGFFILSKDYVEKSEVDKCINVLKNLIKKESIEIRPSIDSSK